MASNAELIRKAVRLRSAYLVLIQGFELLSPNATEAIGQKTIDDILRTVHAHALCAEGDVLRRMGKE